MINVSSSLISVIMATFKQFMFKIFQHLSWCNQRKAEQGLVELFFFFFSGVWIVKNNMIQYNWIELFKQEGVQSSQGFVTGVSKK